VASFDPQLQMFVGSAGSLAVLPGDEVAFKLAMLLDGECNGLGPLQAAQKFGFSKPRYFQLRQAFLEQGSSALSSLKRGPKRNYRRTDEVVRQIIRHRFLDPEASADVIAQKLRQTGWVISTRSVERTIAHFGLQKKTPSLPPDY
jgi:transposase